MRIDVSRQRENRLALVGRGVGHLVVEGIEITGHVQGLKFKDGHDIVVRDCRAHHGETGLSLEGTSARDLCVERVELSHNTRGGLDVADGVALERVTFRDCRATDNACEGGTDGFGISHGCTTRDVCFERCEASRNGSDGFDISGKQGYGVTLVDCVAHHNGTRMWGANFKCWNPGSVFANCVGFSTGPHVHYEVKVNGTAVNPASFL